MRNGTAHRGADACCRRACSATTPTSTSAGPTTRRRPRRCSTCSATSTATATAGASMPDGSAARLQVRHRARRSSTRLFTQLVEEEPRRDRHPHGDRRRQVARPPQEVEGWASCRPGTSPGTADYPDGENFYQLLYGPNCGSSNDGCFQLPEFDRLYEQAAVAPAAAPSAPRIYQQMARLVAVYAPFKLNVHRKRNQFAPAVGAGLAQAPVHPRGLALRRHRPRGSRQVPEMSRVFRKKPL